MTTQTLRTPASSRGLRLIDIVAHLGTLRAIARQRRELASMDDHMLRDIGLSRDEAEREASRSLWDVPGTWIH